MKKCDYYIRVRGGDNSPCYDTVSGYIVNVDGIDFGVHRGKYGWIITHIPTGFAVLTENMTTRTRKQSVDWLESSIPTIKKTGAFMHERTQKAMQELYAYMLDRGGVKKC